MNRPNTVAQTGQDHGLMMQPSVRESGFITYDRAREDAVFEQCKTELAVQGWTVLENIPKAADAERFLGRLGPLLPQYNGQVTYEVTLVPGHEGFQYSQSMNEVKPHTEAPGFVPPPHYLALHCHRQATCGGGHTLIADGFQFIASLPEELREQAHTHPIDYQITPTPGASIVPSIKYPLVSQESSGVRVLRYSYNLMRYGHIHPKVDEAGSVAQWNNPFFREMCSRGLEFFDAHQTRVLVPTQGLLIFDNFRMLHARYEYKDPARHLTRYWIGLKG